MRSIAPLSQTYDLVDDGDRCSNHAATCIFTQIQNLRDSEHKPIF